MNRDKMYVVGTVAFLGRIAKEDRRKNQAVMCGEYMQRDGISSAETLRPMWQEQNMEEVDIKMRLE